MSESLLNVDNLVVDFATGDEPVHAVRGISLSLAPHEVLGIVGESGSGKSVTALATMGLLPKNARVTGSITYEGRELLGLKEKELAKVRGMGIAMIFQDPMTSLNPVYKVGWQIAEAIRAHQDVSKDEALAKAVTLLETVGIPNAAERVGNYPHEFSGGMRQRVVIAIAMANNPAIILADEPTTALDVTVQAQVLSSLKAALAETRASLLLITHDLGVIAGLADRVLVMYAGRPVEVGTVEQIFYQPSMPYTHGLLGSLPRLDSQGGERLRQIPGSPPSMAGEGKGCPFAPRCPMRADICDEEEPELRPLPVVPPVPLTVTDPGTAHEPSAPSASDPSISNGSAEQVHLSACHFAEQVARLPVASMFPDTSADHEGVAG
jgi:oligopeptide/dipeptide ABC transporter ATP-binding protein